MVNLDIRDLRPNLDLENKYVDFSFVRNALSVASVVKDLQIVLSTPTEDAECRGTCPKCAKERSFSLNINTNRFNCFAKGCALKGGGVIDFFAKLYQVSAKEASHLLACAYGIQPYTQEIGAEAATNQANEKPTAETVSIEREVGEVPASSWELSHTISPLTAQHLIASIEDQLAQLKQLLAPR
jgi:hypothetical protein